jgi:hypothetical protein
VEKKKMKTRFLIPILALSLLISTTPFSFGESSNEHVLGIVEWQYDCHPLVFNSGLIRVIDPDMNIDDDLIDRFDIEVLSDYNVNNIQKYVDPIHTVIETGNSTGIFESTIFWGDPHDEGIGHRVPIWNNVTVTANYTDHTLPLSYLDSSLDLTNSIIVKDVKPIERENSDGVFDFYYVYEPCTIELWDMKNDPRYTVNHDFIFPPPLKQLKSGVTTDEIQCKDGLVLLQKYNGSPACIKPETVPKLVTREWGTSDNWIKLSNADKSIHYELDGGKIISADAFSEYTNLSLPEERKQTWLKIKLKSTQDGSLQVTLPRNLIDSKINDIDDDFFVLLDGIETKYQETKTEYERTLEFSFTSETDIVEIVGYGYHNSELNTFDNEYLSELDKQCSIDKPGSKWSDVEQLCVYANTATVGGHAIPDSNVDLSAENTLIQSDSRHMFLEQLQKTPRIESMQNFTDTARDFVVSEALDNSEVSDLLSGNQYEVRCCTFSFDRNDISYNRYVGLVFDVPEKYMKVVVTYDLAKQQISGVSTEILLEDGIIKVGEKNEN